MKRIISLPTTFVITFLIFNTPSVLSADSDDSKNIWLDNSCITELKNSEYPWLKKLFENRPSPWDSSRQHVSSVFVGEVVWAQLRKEVEFVDCGMGVGARDVRYRVTEVLMGDLKVGSEVKLRHDWCSFFDDIYIPGNKIIIGFNERTYSNFPELASLIGKVNWELPFSPEKHEIAKTFIQCIHDKGIVKAMEEVKEDED